MNQADRYEATISIFLEEISISLTETCIVGQLSQHILFFSKNYIDEEQWGIHIQVLVLNSNNTKII